MFDSIFHFGSGFCHQLPARSYFFADIQMPLCARCSGIYLAFVLTVLALYFVYRREQRATQARGLAFITLAIFVALMAFDGLSSYLGFRETNNLIRLLTGSGMGVALASFTYPMVNDSLLKNKTYTPIYTAEDKSLYLLFMLPFISAALYLGLGVLAGKFLFIISADLILSTFVYVALVLVAIIPRFENSVEKPRDTLVPLLCALGFALIALILLFVGQHFLKVLLV